MVCLNNSKDIPFLICAAAECGSRAGAAFKVHPSRSTEESAKEQISADAVANGDSQAIAFLWHCVCVVFSGFDRYRLMT